MEDSSKDGGEKHGCLTRWTLWPDYVIPLSDQLDLFSCRGESTAHASRIFQIMHDTCRSLDVHVPVLMFLFVTVPYMYVLIPCCGERATRCAVFMH